MGGDGESMENVKDTLLMYAQQIANFFSTLGIWDVLDILILSYLIYKLLVMARKTNISRLLMGVALFVLALFVSSGRMRALNFLLSRVVDIGILALVIIFQPEIRHILEQLGSTRWNFLELFTRKEADRQSLERAIVQTVVACGDMSRSRTGALIVFERNTLLDDYVRTGTVLDAEVTVELLENIFFVKAPLHDGAVIVRQGRILRAGCVLPLSRNENLSKDLGTRHRAGIGMSEHSDAVVVLVSEETGSISVAVGGMLKRHLMTETLEQLLRNELLPQEEEAEPGKKSILKALKARKGGVSEHE